ncbi:MAG: NPCBM/NEW2 domain-containing protein [Pirellulales bacterium]|nr:NPCBM/NEW2 domain-containing protein [Pirellulales bacterium]
MTSAPSHPDLPALLSKVADGGLTAQELERLEAILLEDSSARAAYHQQMRVHAMLYWRWNPKRKESATLEPQVPAPSFPALSPLPSPLSSSFVGGPVFSYLVATVVLCLMLLGGWAYKISPDYDLNVVDNSRSSTTSGPMDRVYVGRITGMKDCRWANEETQTVVGASVPLAREYALISGLLQITYKTGARVILEGPCTYKVDSTVGGYLKTGKLTARVETKGSGFRVQGSGHSPLFAVCTPTAIITDLGTEFGVEVSENGDTTSYVFEGKIVVKAGIRGFGDSGIREVQLGAGESVMVGRVRETHQDSGTASQDMVRFTQTATPPKFVRRLYEPPKQLDLLDIVAGGNGTGNRRERGIDPSTGKQDTWFLEVNYNSDSQYHSVKWHSFIDGVFIPYVPTFRFQKVQIDSSGNAYDGFTDDRDIDGVRTTCTVSGKTIGGIWARAVDKYSAKGDTDTSGWIYVMGKGEQYMPSGRGLLGMHASTGITFDLEAMRKTFVGVRPASFQATIGLGDGPRTYPELSGMADIWIFIDGQLKWKRLNFCHKDGAAQIDIPLKPNDRFLTIATTNGLNGTYYVDWIVFGDPVLRMEPTTVEKP